MRQLSNVINKNIERSFCLRLCENKVKSNVELNGRDHQK